MTEQICNWMKVWHPQDAVQVTVALRATDPQSLLAEVHSYFEAGWLVKEPSLAEGEAIEEVGLVVHSQKDGREGTTEVIDLYVDHEAMVYPVLRVYLNNQEEIHAFEQASGLKVAALPIYEGTGRIKRGQDKRLDAKIVKAPHHFKVVTKPNPKHDPNETDIEKKKPKRLFVRWHGQTPPPTPPHTTPPTPPPVPEQKTSTFDDKEEAISQSRELQNIKMTNEDEQVAYIEKVKTIAICYGCRERIEKMADGPHRRRLWEALKSRVAWLLRQQAANATASEALADIGREAAKWELGQDQINLIDQQCDTTFKVLAQATEEAATPF